MRQELLKGAVESQEITVLNPGGVHLRPAMALTKLCIALRDHAGVHVIISKSGQPGTYIDPASDYELAQKGFGVAFFGLTEMGLEYGMKAHVQGGGDGKDRRQILVVLGLVKEILTDPETLESGGNNERMQGYLKRAGVPVSNLAFTS